MKLSVSNYSYYGAIKNGTLTPFDCIAKTKELGFDAIEIVDFVSFGGHDESEWEGIAREIKAECDRLDLEISSLTCGADLLKNGDEDVKKLALAGEKTGLAFQIQDISQCKGLTLGHTNVMYLQTS